MYSRMKRKCSFIVLVVMVVSLLMVSGTPVHADSYSWMESAKKVKINSTIKGVARNNQPPTLMDPWDSYEEYFYFKAPVKMNITITVERTSCYRWKRASWKFTDQSICIYLYTGKTEICR